MMNTIEAGVGKIQYQEPDSLLLAQLMENLERAIERKGAKAVSEALSEME